MAKATQLETVQIGLQHLDDVANVLFKRLQPEEIEQLIKLFVKRETAKKIEESQKRGKVIEMPIEQFTMEIERRMLNKLVYLEAKQKILGRDRT